jgi:hypothetical protein
MSLDASDPLGPTPDPPLPIADPQAVPAGDTGPIPTNVADSLDETDGGDDLPSSDESGGQNQANSLNRVRARDISIFNNAFQIMAAQRRSQVREFSFADGREATKAEEDWAVEYFAGIGDEADGLLRHLAEQRVLLLSAEPGARKVTAATALAIRLRERNLCTGSVLLIDPVDRHVRVDVPRLPVKDAQLKDRVVIFRYALSRGNPDLTDMFGKTDHQGWRQLTDRLRQANAYLVFTATSTETEQFGEAHAFPGVHRKLAPHPREVRAQRFDSYLETLRKRGEASVEALDALKGFRDRLVERISFAPQLVDFSDFFVGLQQPSMEFEATFALFQDTSKRLLHELDDDFDAWSFGFALALAQCTPDAGGVPWVDFDRLRRHLRRWLQRDLQIASGPRAEDQDAESSEVRLELSDDTLLTRSRAVVKKDPVTLADMIRFCDGRPPQRLWHSLLNRHRRVLTAIIPRLRELAERPDQDGPSMSVLAAQIIGRIGEMDWERLVVPMIDRWAELGGRHHGLIGAMFEGVLGSDEPRFHARCLQYLKSMHAGSPAGRGKNRVEAAIAAYSWVGYHDFPLAIRELYAIVRAHLTPMIEDAARMSRLAARIQRDIEKAAGNSDEDAVRATREVLRSLVDRIYSQRGGIFLGVQFTLVSLCGTHGVTPVLRELREWIGRGGASTGVLVALMFLHERGIANQLREDRVEIPQGEGVPPVTCGQFVRALAGGEEDVRQAVRFLGDLYDSVTSPWAAETLVRRHVRERLQAHLLDWVQEALPVPDLATPVRTLIEQLSRTHDGRIHDIVLQLVSGGEFKRKPELKSFAATLQL